MRGSTVERQGCVTARTRCKPERSFGYKQGIGGSDRKQLLGFSHELRIDGEMEGPGPKSDRRVSVCILTTPSFKIEG